MGLSIGGIVSLGGGSGGGGGSTSGIQSINGQTGPAIVVTGVNGVAISAAGNVITIDGAGASGTAGPASSQSGVIGVNGITVEQIGGNFVVNGASLSGLIGQGTVSGISVNAVASYSALFSSLTSGLFDHNFGTRETIVQIYDDSLPPRVILPDHIISENLNQVGVLFNQPQNGRIVIHAPSGVINASSSTSVTLLGVSGVIVIPSGTNTFIISGEGVSGNSSSICFSQAFTNATSVTGVHNFNALDVITQVYDENNFVVIPDTIQAVDVNTIVIGFNQPSNGTLVVHGCGSTGSTSGVGKFSQSFSSVSSLNVTHGMNTADVIVQVRNADATPKVVIPDEISIIDVNTVGLRFNSIRSGRVTIIG